VIQLINADCMDVLEIMTRRTGNFDMIFVDPPFTEWHASDIGKLDINRLSWYVSRLLKPNGVVWLWGYIPQLIEDWKYWGRWFKCVFDMIRVKPNIYPPATNPQTPIRAHENIWCLIKKDTKLSDTKLQMRRKTIVVKQKEKTGVMRQDGRPKVFKEYKRRAYVRSYQTYPSIGKNSKEYYGHPTQKPERLVALLIETSTEQGDWILDPFAGSGTTLVVAERLGRNAIGIELSKEYCKIIRKRLENERALRRWRGWLNTQST